MSRNVVIGAVVVIALAIGGWWYVNQSSVPATSDTAQEPIVSSQNSSSANKSVASDDTELCRENARLTFTSGTSLVDSHTKTSFVVPHNTVSIVNAEKCPSLDTFRTIVSLGKKNIYITATPEGDQFGEWNAGVPITKLETITIQVGGNNATATVYDVEVRVNGEWKPYGEPFLMVFVERNDLHYMLHLPYDSAESKQVSISFLSSLSFIQ